MNKNRIGTIPQTGNNKGDEAAEVVAEVFGVTAHYVRQLVKGREMKTPTAKKKAKHILKAYWNYKRGKDVLKTNLIKAVEKVTAVC